MASPRVGLSAELCVSLFPFHLAFNRDMEIVQVGAVLQRVCPGLAIGSRLQEYFRIKRPHIPGAFDTIREQARSIFLLESLHSALLLKGQIVHVEQPDVILFLCFPAVTDLTALGELGLALDDFPSHNSVAEFLFLLQAQHTALADARKLTHSLTRQRADLRRANQHLATQYAVTRILAESMTLSEAAPKLLAAICDALDWQLGTLWSVDEHANVLRCEEVWNTSPGQFAAFEAATRRLTCAPGVELPGRVWRRGAPVWVTDVSSESGAPRVPHAAAEGLHGGCGIPIESGSKVIGVLEFYSHDMRQPDHDLLQMLTGIGSQIGQFTERKRAEKALRDLATQLENANRTLERRVAERTAQLAQANAEITALNAQLTTENLRLGAELEVTRKLQQMLLPKAEELQQIDNLDIACYMAPADEVGGDYYDVLQHNGRIKIGIGDVTGHGLESGVLMLMTQAIVRALLTHGETDPVRFLDTLNRTLYGHVQRMGSDKNLTLALLDYTAGEVRLSGQHEEMLVIRQGGAVERVETVDLGFPLGLVDEIANYIKHQTVRLQPGDGVVLYTDGITEAVNAAGKQYGLERLCAVMRQHWGQPAEAVKDAVVADVRRHIGDHKVYDDITLVVVKQQ